MSLLDSERGYVDLLTTLFRLGGGRLTDQHRADLQQMRASADGDDVRRIDELLAGRVTTPTEPAAPQTAAEDAWQRGAARAAARSGGPANSGQPAAVSSMFNDAAVTPAGGER